MDDRDERSTEPKVQATVISLANRLRDGREIKTTADFQQWVYEYLDNFSNDIGEDHTPIDMFPSWIRVMVEWCEVTTGIGCDKENAQALTRAIGELTEALERCLAQLKTKDEADRQ